jgi:hypothetical protein
MSKITITIAQLTKAQMGEEVKLSSGHTLLANPTDNGGWKFYLFYGYMLAFVRYVDVATIKSVEWALNASDEEYMQEQMISAAEESSKQSIREHAKSLIESGHSPECIAHAIKNSEYPAGDHLSSPLPENSDLTGCTERYRTLKEWAHF